MTAAPYYRNPSARIGAVHRRYIMTNMNTAALPPLPLAEWKATYDTLHMWTQIVGKVRLALRRR